MFFARAGAGFSGFSGFSGENHLTGRAGWREDETPGVECLERDRRRPKMGQMERAKQLASKRLLAM
mgnify:CR=1 FL=1